jgi:hypothetical protein
MSPRLVLVPSVLLPAMLLGAACGTSPTGRPPQPPASYTLQQELNRPDILLAGAEYARQQGYQVGEAQEAVELRPNYWRVRFALAERGSGRLLELEFDEATRSVVRSQEVEVVPTAPLTGRGPTQ